MNLPNKLSVLRLLLIPVFVAVFYINFSYHYLAAAILFAVAALTDFLDGYIARKYGMVTDLGKFLDSCADKVLVLSALVLMTDARIIPAVWAGICCSVILAREIIISCLRMVAASKGIVMAADKLGKIKTILQDISIVILIVSAEFYPLRYDCALFVAGAAALGLSVIMAIISAIHYFYVNKGALGERKQ